MKRTSKEFRDQVEAIAKIADEDIDISEMPELTHDDFLHGERAKFYKPIKRSTTIRLDADVVEWFKRQNEPKGYQTRINEALRSFMLREIRKGH